MTTPGSQQWLAGPPPRQPAPGPQYLGSVPPYAPPPPPGYAGSPLPPQGFTPLPPPAFPPAPGPMDGMPGPVGGNGIYCRVCGATPAANVSFRGHQGMIFVMRFLRRPGPFCRDCGLATYREMTSRSLVQGWWGWLSMFINPITMLVNLAPRRTVAALPPPVPGSPRPPLDPGRPMLRRPAMLMLLLPLVGIVAVVVACVVGAKSDPEYASVGDCVYDSNGSSWKYADDNHPDVSKVSCSDSRAQAEVVGKVNGTTDGKSACAVYPTADSYYYYSYTGTEYTLCLRTIK